MALVDELGVIDTQALNGHHKRFAMSRAKAGLKWLRELGDNEHLKLSRVNLATLDIADADECVLSQAHGTLSFGWVVQYFGLSMQWLTEHGFEGCSCENAAHLDQHVKLYDALNEAWRKLLTPQEA